MEVLCRAWRPPVTFAAWVALLCRAGGALPRGWWCFAGRVVVLCRAGAALPRERSDPDLLGAYGGTPGGKARPTRQTTSTRAAKRDPRGKPPPPARQSWTHAAN